MRKDEESVNVKKKNEYNLYIKLAKACENVDVVGFRPYTWNNCEQRKGNVG